MLISPRMEQRVSMAMTIISQHLKGAFLVPLNDREQCNDNIKLGDETFLRSQ